MRRVMWILTGALAAAAVLALVFPRTPSQTEVTGTTTTPAPSPSARLPVPIDNGAVVLGAGPASSSQDSTKGGSGDDGIQPEPPPPDDPPRPRDRCPAADTCDRHRLRPGRWKATEGKIRVEYWINPHEQQWFPPPYRDIELAIRTAADTWMDAHPGIELVYKGFTEDQPLNLTDKNVIGWFPLGPSSSDPDEAGSADLARTSPFVDNDGFLVEVDTQINQLFPMDWTACDKKSGSCTDIAYENPPRPYDLQNTMTHEFGHWLGLEDLDDDKSVEQTMYENPEPGWRRQSTLALGDLCGFYKAYPGPDCEESVIYVP